MVFISNEIGITIYFYSENLLINRNQFNENIIRLFNILKILKNLKKFNGNNIHETLLYSIFLLKTE